MDRRTPNKFKFVQSGRRNGSLATNLVANGGRATVEGGARAMAERVDVFCDMLCDRHVKPNRFPFPSVLKACARASKGKQVHGLILRFGFDGDECVTSHLVRMELDKMRQDRSVLWIMMFDGHVRLGHLKNAKNLFDEMPHRSEVSWNVMISGYSQNGHFMEAKWVSVWLRRQWSWLFITGNEDASTMLDKMYQSHKGCGESSRHEASTSLFRQNGELRSDGGDCGRMSNWTISSLIVNTLSAFSSKKDKRSSLGD
ncbi:Pentatricopeptide repeat-containing protein, partial [Cucurbita argyrosperma subsp. sororia]